MKSLILIASVLFFSAFSFALSTIDLNSATQAQIEELPGVGPALAKKIIAARPLKTFDDLKNVKGLGSKADKLKDMISFGSTAAVATPVTPAIVNQKVTAAPTLAAATTAVVATKDKVVAQTKLAIGQKISLNSATKEDLMKLPGIGEKKAELIIQNRPFKTLEDVMKIKGIKEGIFAKIKDNLSL